MMPGRDMARILKAALASISGFLQLVRGVSECDKWRIKVYRMFTNSYSVIG
jgi:hypothetical protein